MVTDIPKEPEIRECPFCFRKSMFDMVYRDSWTLYECFYCKKHVWEDELGNWHLRLFNYN